MTVDMRVPSVTWVSRIATRDSVHSRLASSVPGMALELTPASSVPLQVVDVAAPDEVEAAYVRAARAANTG